MPLPAGYRKAMRVMELADRHAFPVISLVDTPGAYPGVVAEQHGQGGWIARCQLEMMRLGIPTVACVIGEGGSGGAVAIAVADRVLMQENAIYSVISPEGCAAILWRDASEAKKAAAAFKPDARHCLDLGVIDAIVPEPEAGRTRIRTPRRRSSPTGSTPRSRTPVRAMLTRGEPRGGRDFAKWAYSLGSRAAFPSFHRDLPIGLLTT
jgi:acetyl-CoA carboxylase carboxyl transferase alpha subunit